MAKAIQVWRMRVREVYASLAELEHYDGIYGIAKRCKFRTCKALWHANPMIQGSTDPKDFGLAK